MNSLGIDRYIPVLLKAQKSSPLLVDLKSGERIIYNASFLRALAIDEPKDRSKKLHHYFNRLKFVDKKSNILPTTLDRTKKALLSLGLKTHLSDKSFISIKEHEKTLDECIVLPTELLFYTSGQNLGSSRHALLRDLQIKGCGKNALATRLDYLSTWGGMHLKEAVFSYIASNGIHHTLPLGSMRTVSASIYQELEQQWTSQNPAFVLREADTVRSIQILKHEFNSLERTSLLSSLAKQMGTTSCKDQLHHLVFQHACSLYFNIHQRFPTPGNTTMDSRMIDCETVISAPDRRNLRVYLHLALPRSVYHGKNPSKITREKVMALLSNPRQSPELLYSNVHGTLFSLEQILDNFNWIHSSNFSYSDVFLMMHRYFSKLCERDALPTVSTSALISNYLGILRYSSREFTPKQDLPQMGHEPFQLNRYLAQVESSVESWSVVATGCHEDLLLIEVAVDFKSHFKKTAISYCANQKVHLNFNQLTDLSVNALTHGRIHSHAHNHIQRWKFSDALKFSSLVNRLTNFHALFNPHALKEDHVVDANTDSETYLHRLRSELKDLAGPQDCLFNIALLSDKDMVFRQTSYREFMALGASEGQILVRDVIARFGKSPHYLLTRPERIIFP